MVQLLLIWLKFLRYFATLWSVSFHSDELPNRKCLSDLNIKICTKYKNLLGGGRIYILDSVVEDDCEQPYHKRAKCIQYLHDAM